MKKAEHASTKLFIPSGVDTTEELGDITILSEVTPEEFLMDMDEYEISLWKSNNTPLNHEFHLRSNFIFRIILPTNLSSHEASRLAEFARNLSLNEDFEDHWEDSNSDNLDTHMFKFRKNEAPVAIVVPENINHTESQRLGSFLGALSFRGT